MNKKLLLLIFLATNYSFKFEDVNKPTPVVLWHGMGNFFVFFCLYV